MTIRQYINKRLVAVLILGLICLLCSFVAMHVYPDKDLNNLNIASTLLMVGVIIYGLFFIKCPRCKTRIFQTAIHTSIPFSKKSVFNFCPNCGVNLDESI